jgi:hypothetical protein
MNYSTRRRTFLVEEATVSFVRKRGEERVIHVGQREGNSTVTGYDVKTGQR